MSSRINVPQVYLASSCFTHTDFPPDVYSKTEAVLQAALESCTSFPKSSIKLLAVGQFALPLNHGHVYHYVVGKLTAVHMLVFEKIHFLKDRINILSVKPIDYAVLRAVIRKSMSDLFFFKKRSKSTGLAWFQMIVLIKGQILFASFKDCLAIS